MPSFSRCKSNLHKQQNARTAAKHGTTASVEELVAAEVVKPVPRKKTTKKTVSKKKDT